MANQLSSEKATALAMFEGEVPCTYSMIDGCGNKAGWLVEIVHLGDDCGKLEGNPAPFCDRHKEAIAAGFNPFWKTYLSAPRIDCSDCGVELGLGEVTKL